LFSSRERRLIKEVFWKRLMEKISVRRWRDAEYLVWALM